jgi:hypothetical protein
MPKPNGYVLYTGPSLLDGANIVVIATGFASSSKNVKTGGMIQTYILRTDRSPVDAVKSGADASICGACPHRGDGTGAGRTCYVNVGQGPLAVWRAWRAGKYPALPPVHGRLYGMFAGLRVRFGTYGDPAAVSWTLWRGIAAHAAGWTGYTHQWRVAPALAAYCMASVDNIEEAQEAQAAGWRTFRVALPDAAARIMNEVICPASAEAGKKLQCADCMACSGGQRKGSIVIKAHGGFAVMHNIKKRAAA